jgi:hypothetical protein
MIRFQNNSSSSPKQIGGLSRQVVILLTDGRWVLRRLASICLHCDEGCPGLHLPPLQRWVPTAQDFLFFRPDRSVPAQSARTYHRGMTRYSPTLASHLCISLRPTRSSYLYPYLYVFLCVMVVSWLSSSDECQIGHDPLARIRWCS